MKLIEIKNASYSYEGEDGLSQKAVEGVSLDIQKGEFLALVGHNGSGKSTFAKLLNGILVPREGSVIVDGLDTADENNLLEIHKKVGMVFQNPDNQIVATLVEEDVAFGPENLGFPREDIRKRVDRALKTVGMSEYATHASHLLSGGQKQRLAIAGVLAMSPECIVLDEPTAMLDPEGRREVLETIMRLCREEGITIVLVTHYMEEAAYADRIAIISAGRIEKTAPPEEIFSEPERLKEAGLELPQPARLLYELKSAGIDAGGLAAHVDGCVNLLEKLLKGKGRA